MGNLKIYWKDRKTKELNEKGYTREKYRNEKNKLKRNNMTKLKNKEKD